MEKKHVVIGLSRSGFRVIKNIADIFKIIVIERDESKLEELKAVTESNPNISLIKGDGTSIYFWKHEVNIEEIESVILFVDDELALEIGNLLRNIVKFEGPIVCVWRGGEIPQEFSKYRISVIDVPKLIYLSLLNIVKGGNLVRYAYGMGLEKGEIAEVTITETSPALKKSIKHLGMKNVRIVLLYRDNKIILPKGDTVIEQGDRIVIAGDSEYVKTFTDILLKGIPDFPLRWGSKLIYCPFNTSSSNEEINYLKSIMMIQSVIRSISRECENAIYPEDTGVIAFDYKKKGLLGINMVDFSFKRITVPVLFLGGTHPYKNVLISLNTDAKELLLSSGIDIIRQANARGTLLYVATIENMRTEEEKEYIKSLRSVVNRYINTYHINIELKIKEGNPVRETLKEIDKYNLLILGYKAGKTSTFFEPYTPHLLAKKSYISTLLIPSV